MSASWDSSSLQPKPPFARHNSQGQPVDPDQRDPDDGYDYNRVDEAPETQPTVKTQGQVPDGVLKGSHDPQRDLKGGDPDASFEETRPHIYRRRFAGRRIQVPDAEQTPTNGAPRNPQENGSQPRIETDLSTASRDSVKARHIALSWNIARRDTQQILELNLAAPQTKSKDEVLPKRVLWQHVEQRLMSIQNMEDEIIQCQSRGISESEVGLAKRLLERVRSTSERPFVGGRFLVPTALRYDNQDVSRYTVDETCIFFSFPYFSVADTSYGKFAGKGKADHPPRTLLQSRYRLHQTVDRDNKQCIRLLDGKRMASSVAIQGGDDISIHRAGMQHLVYVPQLWGVIIGLDTLVTCAPLSEAALQSSSIVTIKANPSPTKSSLALVRIQFGHHNEREDLIYPINQCNSWFGLLNKQQQIIEFLDDDKGKAKPRDYRFWLDHIQITRHNWTDLLEESQSVEMLSIWMKVDPSDVPEITVSQAADPAHKATTSASGSMIRRTKIIPKPNMNAIISPILAWPILDNFGDKDKHPVPTRIERFLARIYVFLFIHDGIHKQQRAMRPTFADAQRSATNERIPKAAKALPEISALVEGKPQVSEVYEKFYNIFRLFIPDNHDQRLPAIQLYWGGVHEIIEGAEMQAIGPGMKELLGALDSIVHHGTNLHEGVYSKSEVRDVDTQAWVRTELLAEGTILLATMVDALGSIFHMLVEIIRFLRDSSKASDANIMGSRYHVFEHSSDTVKYLTTGRDQLVRELHGRDRSNTIGPVVTPEAITIKLMERLVSGVFQKSRIDVIQLYEECLEYLSLKVESEASRRLLQKINIFQDEVAVISRVLKEQHDVLLSLCKSLDPDSFRSASIARKLRYDFECKAFKKVLGPLEEQLRNCGELQERAKELAVQNVQLVETLQDDQSRAIFVFTIVTIIFLPLSFVAGFFGMNFESISKSTYGVEHFWVIAGPLTLGVFALCTFIAFKGEVVFFWFVRGSHWLTTRWNKEGDE